MTYAESSDSETGVEAKRSWSANSDYSQEHSPRTSKKPSSAGSFRKGAAQRIKRTASMDSIDLLRSVPSASTGKGLSEKVGWWNELNEFKNKLKNHTFGSSCI